MILGLNQDQVPSCLFQIEVDLVFRLRISMSQCSWFLWSISGEMLGFLERVLQVQLIGFVFFRTAKKAVSDGIAKKGICFRSAVTRFWSPYGKWFRIQFTERRSGIDDSFLRIRRMRPLRTDIL